jgi:glycerophosphoryl diester phosphodiesterase
MGDERKTSEAAQGLGWRWRRRPWVIAHRGASREEPENTLRAFRRARELGADGVELDVRRCASGELVVFHDRELPRQGRRRRLPVAALPLAALRSVELGRGERIPTLEEALEELGTELLVNVELKVETLRATGIEAELARVVERMCSEGEQERLLVSSFNPLALLRTRTFAPRLARALLVQRSAVVPRRSPWWLRFASLLEPSALHPERRLCSRESVLRWRRRGWAVNVWTVDHPDEWTRLVEWGVDGIITNDPAEALRRLKP